MELFKFAFLGKFKALKMKKIIPIENRLNIPQGCDVEKFNSKDSITTLHGFKYKLIAKKKINLSFKERLEKLVQAVGNTAKLVFSEVFKQTTLNLTWKNTKRLWIEGLSGKETVRFGIPQISLKHPTQALKLNLPADLKNPLEFSSEKDLLEKALTFFRQSEKNIAPKIIDRAEFSSLSERQIIDRLLKDYRGLCVGEDHDNISARRFLIEHLPYLYQKGVHYLFLEGLTKDELESYLSWIQTKVLPKIIEEFKSKSTYQEKAEFLRNFFKNEYHYDQNEKGDLKTVVAAEKDTLITLALLRGISVIPNDHKMSGDYFSDYYDVNYRLLTMNYFAYHRIENQMKRHSENVKFVALMGYGHLGEVKSNQILGVPDLLQCPKMAIIDRLKGISDHTSGYLEDAHVDLVLERDVK